MYISRSLLASAIVLSFSSLGEASVLHRKSDADANAPRVQRRWSLPSLFGKRQTVQELECPESSFQALLNHNPAEGVQTFCNDWLDIQPTTVVVEYTPTITSTTSADSTTIYTSTERVYTTETLIVETTTTPAPILPRMVNVAAAFEIDAIASEIVQSVIASGTTSALEAVQATSKSPKRLSAEEGLATACSCKMVDPTSTVISSFALPAVTTTVGYRRIVVSSEIRTKTFTSTTTVNAPRSESTASLASSNSDTDSTSSVEEQSSIAAVTPTAITTTVVTSTLGPSDTLVPVVTAIPFSCPDADNQHVDQVAGPFRLDYLILCNTDFQSQDRIGNPIPVDSETSCAAQCSLINAASGQDTCQGAAFTQYPDGRSGGTCAISGSQGTYVDSPGSIAIVHTGTYANGDECAALSEPSGIIDSSAIVASVTSAGVAISTPGLVTQTSGSGEFHTYVSANSTDASGFVHWSWYQVDASSMNWWAIYQTSWACTFSYTRTIEQAATIIDGSTITVVGITTIIGGGETTVISGNATTTITGGNGVITPTFVAASTTGGNGEFTTFFSSAVEGSIVASGVIPPSPTPTASAATVSQTSVIAGSAALTLSGESSGASSTGDAGVNSPSPSSHSSAESSAAISSAAAPVQLSGSAELTVSSSASGVSSTGDEGVVSPPVTESSVVSSTPSATSPAFDEWDDENSYGPRPPRPTPASSAFAASGSAAVTVSTGTSILSSTGANGVVTPILVTETTTLTSTLSVESFSPAVINSTALPTQIGPESSQAVTIESSVISGVGNLTISGGASAVSSTGGEGVVPPETTVVVTTTESTTLSLPSDVVIEGSGGFTIQGGTSRINSTGGNGVIPPATTVVVTTSATLVQPSVSVVVIEGSGNFTIGGGTAVTVSTDSAGVVSPSPSSSTLTESPTLSSTPTPIPSGSTLSENLSSTEGDRSGGFSRSRSSAVSASGSGSLPPVTSNGTTEATPSATPPSALNSTTTLTVFTVLSTTSASSTLVESLSSTEGDRSGGFSRSRSSAVSASESGYGPPSPPVLTSNGTTEAPPSATLPPASLNSTTTITVLTVMNTTSASSMPFESLSSTEGDRSGGFSRSRSSAVSASGSGYGTPSPPILTSNGTTEAPPSATLPPASLNSTTTITVLTVMNTTSASSMPFESLSSTEGDRSGDFSRSRSSAVSASGSGYGPPSRPALTSSRTTQAPPSATLPPASLNSTTTLTVLNTTSSTLSENLSTSEGDRSGGFSRSRSSAISASGSGSLPPVTSNGTMGAPPSATPPPASLNSTTTTESQIVVVVTVSSTLSVFTPIVNTTAPAASSDIPPASANSTAFLPTGPGFSAQVFRPTVTVTVNSTLSVPLPTSNLTLIPPVTTTYPNTTVLPPSSTGNATSLASTVSLVSVNYTTVSSFSVGNISTILPTPSAPANMTSSASLPIGNLTSVLSATPTVSLNSTVPTFPISNSTTLISSTASEACPTATEFSVRTRVSIITTTIIETIPIGPSTCLTSDAAFPTGNLTLPLGAGSVVLTLPTVDLPTATLPTPEASTSDLSTPTPVVSLFRRANTPATEEQIAAACADSGNVVVAPNFVITPDDSTPGWTTDNKDITINVASESTQDYDGEIARFRSAYPGRSLTLVQPLTVCPGRQYELSALVRQLNSISRCKVTFTVGNDDVLTSTPQTDWLEQNGRFTAGPGPSGASVLLKVRASCAGQSGAPVGANEDGFMVVEVGKVSVAANDGK